MTKNKSFLIITFGCRVNAAESNQFAQALIDKGFTPLSSKGGVRRTEGFIPDIIFINTCSITQKGEYESLSKIRTLSTKYPNSKIIVSGCADLSKVKNLPNIQTLSNQEKEVFLNNPLTAYTPQIKDKFTKSKKYLLKIQSGCIAGCSYCTVPQKRPYLWSLPINTAIKIVNSALQNGYEHLILTGVNLNLYQPGFSNLLEALLTKTKIPFISFGSIPLLCIDKKFQLLIANYGSRITNFFHIPIQSGSDRILKLMRRPYNKEKIIKTFDSLKKITSPLVKGGTEGGFRFGTDIIVGFPSETAADFQQTYSLCQEIGFSKIHTFRFSPRPHTTAEILYQKSKKIPQNIILSRSRQIRSLVL